MLSPISLPARSLALSQDCSIEQLDVRLSPRVKELISGLEARAGRLTIRDALELFARSDVRYEDVLPFVCELPHAHARRRVALSQCWEVLVMTWRTGQSSAPHDHVGSLCALRVLRGTASETRYALAPDGLVDIAAVREARTGEVVVDSESHIHALGNRAQETLVTLHLYAPPLPELRRYALRPRASRTPTSLLRVPGPRAESVAVIGGGFSGTMVAAQLVRQASESRRALHVTLFDRQSAFGEGAAYRTVDARHLLNVPAARMSAWPDRPEDFLRWAASRDASTGPYAFVPRRWYGEYLRETFFATCRAAGPGVSIELRQEAVRSIAPRVDGGYGVESTCGRELFADKLVLATGHRPPGDLLGERWSGSRARLIADPWSSLALTAIRPDETVVIFGTGLTTIDVLLTLAREPRSAPIVAISRRGLLPSTHLLAPVIARDAAGWLDPLIDTEPYLRLRAVLRGLRAEVQRASEQGADWRAVVDGLRPHTTRLWRALPSREATRFLTHLRAFWEVHRHRMAPEVARTVHGLLERGLLRVIAGRVLSVQAEPEGVRLSLCRRGQSVRESLLASWVVNCTGPSGDLGANSEPAVASLLHGGRLIADEHGLGVRTGSRGEAIGEDGKVRRDLIVVGPLRKPQLWESTAVPELREQARDAAAALLA